MPLEEYRSKRSADSTPEPFGESPRLASRGGGMFVVHKHAATRLHYDFRLEMEGVLRSWAIPKGPSLNPADKRLAVMVEDHPIEYGDFEGIIPEGNYGAGEVIVWDRGVYRVTDPPDDAAAGVRAGKLDIEMFGFKLKGGYAMVRTSGRGLRARATRNEKPQWLLIKRHDGFASAEADIVESRPRSVLSGLTLQELPGASSIVSGIVAELRKSDAPEIKGPLAPARFPFALAKLVNEPPEGGDWLYEIKYDGVRALAIRDGGSVRIFGRSGLEATANYPEVVLALSKLPFVRFVIDGEIIAFGPDGRPSFQALQRRIQAQDPGWIAAMALGSPAPYYVFDLLAFDRFDLRGLALETRKELLRRMIRDEGLLRYSDYHTGNGRAFYDAVAELGLEGVVAKRLRSPYQAGRGGGWLKIKCPRVERFAIGGWTEPGGSRTHFGALLMGQYEAPGVLRFVGRVGTGFDDERLRTIAAKLRERATDASPFRRRRVGEPAIVAGAHFCAPELVCEVRFTEWTEDGVLRNPSFLDLIADADPAECGYHGPEQSAAEPADELGEFNSSPRLAQGGVAAQPGERRARSGAQGLNREKRNDLSPTLSQVQTLDRERGRKIQGVAEAIAMHDSHRRRPPQHVEITHADKVFWPAEGYTKGDLIKYYETIAPWMLPYLKDRPVMLTRYPDGIEGKSFFQKDAPAYVPQWIRRVRVYSQESEREISYFILESAEALKYIANMGAIPIHIWSSRAPNLGSPDWLLFDIDPKGSTTAAAVRVAEETAAVLRGAAMRPYVKTSGQAGIHVVVGLRPGYTYEQARMFSEAVARVVVARIPDAATLLRTPGARKGKVYIDYLQLGQGKTIAAPFAVRPRPGAPASAPLKWNELKSNLDPGRFNIKTMARRMTRLGEDPFLGALTDLQEIEPALPKVESMLHGK
ncbi:MAG TPA: DNA ligase D [Candidatus Binataceae bacterium]|nr:DNA ligase D [Candidatus Binataceae bacterium]